MKKIVLHVVLLFSFSMVEAQIIELGLRDHSVAFKIAGSISAEKVKVPNKWDLLAYYDNESLWNLASISFQTVGAPKSTRSMIFSLGTRALYAENRQVTDIRVLLGGGSVSIPVFGRKQG
jgi:hypothetical protein